MYNIINQSIYLRISDFSHIFDYYNCDFDYYVLYGNWHMVLPAYYFMLTDMIKIKPPIFYKNLIGIINLRTYTNNQK